MRVALMNIQVHMYTVYIYIYIIVYIYIYTHRFNLKRELHKSGTLMRDVAPRLALATLGANRGMNEQVKRLKGMTR